MFPAFLGAAKNKNEESQNLQNLKGHCFMDIGISTTFEADKETRSVTATVIFDLNESLGFCTEHI